MWKISHTCDLKTTEKKSTIQNNLTRQPQPEQRNYYIREKIKLGIKKYKIMINLINFTALYGKNSLVQ